MSFRLIMLLIFFSVACLLFAASVHFGHNALVIPAAPPVMSFEAAAELFVRRSFVKNYGREPFDDELKQELDRYIKDPEEYRRRSDSHQLRERQESERAEQERARDASERVERGNWVTVTVMLKEQFGQDGSLGLYEAITSSGEHCVVAYPESSAKIGQLLKFKAIKSSQNVKFTQTVRNSRTGAMWEQPLYLPIYCWKSDM